MQKRLSIARTILHSPRILLLDEPETGLDEESIVRLGAIIKYFRNQGCTIVMTTHDVDFGFEFSDRIAVLSTGEIAYIDSISGLNQSEFMSKYRNHIGART
jgi:heme exporter protein A